MKTKIKASDWNGNLSVSKHKKNAGQQKKLKGSRFIAMERRWNPSFLRQSDTAKKRQCQSHAKFHNQLNILIGSHLHC